MRDLLGYITDYAFGQQRGLQSFVLKSKHGSANVRRESSDWAFTWQRPATSSISRRLADAASELSESIFGKEKTSVRSVLGVASLPLGMPVELEVIREVAE